MDEKEKITARRFAELVVENLSALEFSIEQLKKELKEVNARLKVLENTEYARL